MAMLSFLKYLGGIYNTHINRLEGTVHHAVIKSLYDVFDMGRSDLGEMEVEIALATAREDWLDAWGDYFGIYRKSGESDSIYRKRIIDSVISPKTTIPAIKDSLANYLNNKYGTSYTRADIDIREPWKEIAKYSHFGDLSSTARFFSGDYYTHAVIDISIPEVIDQGAIDVANDVKAAGVKVLWSVLNSYDIVDEFASTDEVWAKYIRWIQTHTENNQFTGLVLSNSSPSPVLSGRRMLWEWIVSYYYFTAKTWLRDADTSSTITRRDLMGEVDRYTITRTYSANQQHRNFVVNIDGVKYYVDNLSPVGNNSYVDVAEASSSTTTNTGIRLSSRYSALSDYKCLSGRKTQTYEVTKEYTVTDELIRSLDAIEDGFTLSNKSRLSTSSATMVQGIPKLVLYNILSEQVSRLKATRPDYYNHLQSPIVVSDGNAVMWYVKRNNNWLWSTPTLTHIDLYRYWEPYNTGYTEPRFNIIINGKEYCILNRYWDTYNPVLNETKTVVQVDSKDYVVFYKSPVYLDRDLGTYTYLGEGKYEYVPASNPSESRIVSIEGYPDSLQESNVLLTKGTRVTELTISNMIEFEDMYYDGYLTFGDDYQPPIEVRQEHK